MFAKRVGEKMEWLAVTLTALHRRQPLMVVMVLFLTGIAIGYHFWEWPSVAVCTVLYAIAAAVAVWKVPAMSARLLRGVVWGGLVFLTGWSLAARDRDGRAEEARRLEELAPRLFVCRVGPETIQRPLKGRAAKVTFKGEAFRTEDGAFVCRHLPVEIVWFGAKDSPGAPKPGELWRVKGKGKIIKRRNSGLLYLQVNTGEREAKRLGVAGVSSWKARIDRVRRDAARRVAVGLDGWGDIPALNQAMLLGSRHEMPPAMKRVFVDSGTIHVFAISGLHIVLVAAVLTLAVSVLGVPRMYWLWVVGPLLVFYTVLTGWQPSAVRACVMALVYFVAPLIGRKPSGLAALAGTALILHALQPWLVYDIGSVLSFTVMAGLVVFCRPFCEIARRLCHVDYFKREALLYQMSESAARTKRIEALGTAVRWTADSFAVSLAAFLASVPLTAYYFGRFTPGGLFANLVVGPCSLFIVVAGCLGVAATFVSDWVASCFNHAAGFFTWMMVKTAEITVACPGANFKIEKWSPWLVWVWFSMLLTLAVRLRVRRKDGLDWMDAK